MYGVHESEEMMQATSWIAHMAGVLAILETLGPERFSDEHAHNLFTYGRLHLMRLNKDSPM
jgi:hypothetical protein